MLNASDGLTFSPIWNSIVKKERLKNIETQAQQCHFPIINIQQDKQKEHITTQPLNTDIKNKPQAVPSRRIQPARKVKKFINTIM